MEELKMVKQMYREGKVSREEAKNLIKSIISSEINDGFYKNYLKEEHIKINLFVEDSEKENEANIDINLSLNFLKILGKLGSDSDLIDPGMLDFEFNNKKVKIDVNDILKTIEIMKQQGLKEKKIVIEAEDKTKIIITIYVNWSGNIFVS